MLEGEISVLAALNARNRDVHRILISADKPREDVREIELAAREYRVKIDRVGRADIDTMAQGKTHGGVVAEVGERRFLSLEDLVAPLTPALSPAGRGCITMLDGIEDPFNFGQAVRALYAAGVDGLVVRPRNWLSATTVVTRASAGATEYMPTAIANDPETAAAFFRTRGLCIAATARDRRAISLYDVNLTQPMFLVIGGEKRGMSRVFMDAADVLIKIPYRRKFPHSLGTVASTSITAFEIMRQGFVRRLG